MIHTLLDKIREKYTLQEIEAGEMRTLKANGMKFSVQAYKAEGLGHVSVMQAKGFFGLMKMDQEILPELLMRFRDPCSAVPDILSGLKE